MSGPRSRGSSDTVSPTVITLPSRAWRSVADEIDWVARFEPRHRHRPGAVNRDRRDDHGGVLAQPGVGQRHVVEQRGAGRRARRCHPGHRGGGARTGQRHRIPLPNAKGGNGFRMQPDHAAAGVERRGVQPCGQPQVAQRRILRDLASASSHAPGSAQAEPRHRPAALRPCARRIARRAARCCRGLSSHTSGCSARNAWCGSRTGCG